MNRTSPLHTSHAAAVSQDRGGVARDGDAVVGETGRHGGCEPEADLQPVELAATGRRGVPLLDLHIVHSYDKHTVVIRYY